MLSFDANKKCWKIKICFVDPMSIGLNLFCSFWVTKMTACHCLTCLQVWGLSVMRGGDYIVAGSADKELRVWRVTDAKESDKESQTLVGEDDCSSRLVSHSASLPSYILESNRST